MSNRYNLQLLMTFSDHTSPCLQSECKHMGDNGQEHHKGQTQPQQERYVCTEHLHLIATTRNET